MPYVIKPARVVTEFANVQRAALRQLADIQKALQDKSFFFLQQSADGEIDVREMREVSALLSNILARLTGTPPVADELRESVQGGTNGGT